MTARGTRPSARRTLFGVLGALALASAACGTPDLARRMQAKLRAAMPDASVEIVDDMTLKVKRGDLETTVALDNLSVICKQGQDACDAAMDRAVANQAAFKDASLPAADKLRALLKPRTFLDQVAAAIAQSPPDMRADNELFTQPFGADLVTVLVLDLPDGMKMLSHGDAKKLGLDEAKLREVARANMAKALAPLPVEQVEPGVLRVRAGDDYEAARLLLPEIWNDAAGKLKGDLLVVAPNRNVVFATGSGEVGGIARIRQLAAVSYASEAYQLSTTVFRRTGEAFVPVP